MKKNIISPGASNSSSYLTNTEYSKEKSLTIDLSTAETVHNLHKKATYFLIFPLSTSMNIFLNNNDGSQIFSTLLILQLNYKHNNNMPNFFSEVLKKSC